MKTVQYLSKEALEYGRNATHKEIIEFVENFRELHSKNLDRLNVKKSKKMKLISMKIPEDLLGVFRVEAKKRGTPYQTLIKKLMQEWLKGL